MRKHHKFAAPRLALRRRLNLFSWRWREAFIGLALMAVLSPAAVQAVTLSGVTFSDTNITYEQTGIPNGTTIHFTIDTPGQVQVAIAKVFNAGDTGTTVTTLTQTYALAGAQTLFWNGLWLINGEDGRVNGLYQFTLTLSTGAGSSVVTSPTLVTLNSVDIHSVSALPSLDADGQPTFPFLISYALAKDANVKVQVFNSSNTLVQTLINNKLQVGETVSTQTVTWDGMSAGSPAPVGSYTVTLDATDPSNNGSLAIHRVRTISVTSLAGAAQDPQKLFEATSFVYPNPIRDGQGTFQYQAVRDGASLTLKIYTLTGILVLDKNFGGVPAGAIQTFVWDATNQSGKKVGRGLYFYVLRESDPRGSLEVTKKLVVIP